MKDDVKRTVHRTSAKAKRCMPGMPSSNLLAPDRWGTQGHQPGQCCCLQGRNGTGRLRVQGWRLDWSGKAAVQLMSVSDLHCQNHLPAHHNTAHLLKSGPTDVCKVTPPASIPAAIRLDAGSGLQQKGHGHLQSTQSGPSRPGLPIRFALFIAFSTGIAAAA